MLSEESQWQLLKYHVQFQPSHFFSVLELRNGEFHDEVYTALKGVMTIHAICINVLVASIRMMDHNRDYRHC